MPTEHEREQQREHARLVGELSAIVRHVPQEYEPNVARATLKPWPGNPKEHDIGAIVESMEQNGVYGVRLAQRSSRRLLAGHGTSEALERLGVETVNVLWLDVDDRTAARIVLIENRATQLGGFNDPALLAYLKAMHADDNLLGTGYDGDAMDQLNVIVNAPLFPAHRDATNDPDAPYTAGGEKVTVVVRATDRVVECTRAVAALLEANPAWQATVAGR